MWIAYTRFPSTKVLCTPPVRFSQYSEAIFGCAGSARSRTTIPLRRSEASSRVITATVPAAFTLTSFTTRASTITESVSTGADGFDTSQAYIRLPKQPSQAPQVPVYA